MRFHAFVFMYVLSPSSPPGLLLFPDSELSILSLGGGGLMGSNLHFLYLLTAWKVEGGVDGWVISPGFYRETLRRHLSSLGRRRRNSACNVMCSPVGYKCFDIPDFITLVLREDREGLIRVVINHWETEERECCISTEEHDASFDLIYSSQ